MGLGMNEKIRRALGLASFPTSSRKPAKRARATAATKTARVVARLSRLIVAGAFAFAQPAFAETTLGVSARAGDDGYNALLALLQTPVAAPPSGAGLAQSSSLRDDYAALTDFVRVADASGTVAAPLAEGQANAPDDAIHAGVRGAAASDGDAYSALADFVRTADGSAPASTATQAAPPDDAIHSGLAGAPKTGSDDYSVLSAFAADKDGAAPTVVAAVTRAPKVSKSTAADNEPATYVGSQACVRCHRDQFGPFSQTLHGDIFLKNPRTDQEKLGCETCHGPGSKHVKTKETDSGEPGDIISFSKDSPRSVEDRNAICLSCHEKGDRTYWSGSTHETQGLACTNCHQIMEKVSVKNQMVKSTEVEVCFQCHKDRRAQFERPSHHPLREGDMTCSSCHNPHGSATDSLLRGASINETCYKCHADKRGPFLWEHEPVRESCLNCHEPHGTVNEYLLKVQRPRLCQQCHMGVGHGNPGNPMTVQSINRSCQNCHTKVHGSNSPAGSLFQR